METNNSASKIIYKRVTAHTALMIVSINGLPSYGGLKWLEQNFGESATQQLPADEPLHTPKDPPRKEEPPVPTPTDPPAREEEPPVRGPVDPPLSTPTMITLGYSL